MDNFEFAIHHVLEMEGGLTENRHDPGGITNFGISLRFLQRLPGMEGDVDRDGDVDADDIKAMTPAKAKAYYKKNWWTKYKYARIENAGVARKLLDMSVNMGGPQAHKLIQRACRAVGGDIEDDGVLGPKSILAINTAAPKLLVTAMRCTQAGFYYALVMRNSALRKSKVKRKGKVYPDFSVFLKGWLNRAYM